MKRYTFTSAGAETSLQRGALRASFLTVAATVLIGASAAQAQVQPHWTYSDSTDRITHTSGWQFNVTRLSLTTLSVVSCTASPASPGVLPLGDPVKGYTIVSLAHGSSQGGIVTAAHRAKVTGLTLPGTLKTIGDSAFRDIPTLTGLVVIPDSVSLIGRFAFQRTGITQLSIPTAGLYFGAPNSDVVFQCPSLTAIFWRGAFPASITTAYLIIDNSGNAPITNYVQQAHIASWNAGGSGVGTKSTAVNPKLTVPNSNSMWLGFPIRVDVNNAGDVSHILTPLITTTDYFTLHFNGNGNTGGSMPSLTFTNFVTYTLPPNGFVKEGYAFTGWTNTVPDGTVYANQRQVVNLSPTGGVVTLVATWSANNPRSLTYASGFGATVSDGTHPEGIPVSAAHHTLFQRTGYMITAWTNATLSVEPFDTFIMPNANTTLYAQWEAIHYTVEFDPGIGIGDGIGKSMTFTYDTAQNLTSLAALGFEPPDQINDWVFAGWTLNGTTVAYADGALVNNLTAIPFDTLTLTALWAKTPFYVAFAANGADNASPPMPIQIIPYGEERPLDKNLYTRAGLEFIGWKDDHGIYYTDQQLVKNLTLKGDTVTLYAQWAAPYVGNGNEWLPIDVIKVDAHSGNVTLEWNVNNMKDTALRAQPFHYEIHATDDLTQGFKTVYAENQCFFRDAGADPVHSTELSAFTLGLSHTKMFFKLRAVR